MTKCLVASSHEYCSRWYYWRRLWYTWCHICVETLSALLALWVKYISLRWLPTMWDATLIMSYYCSESVSPKICTMLGFALFCCGRDHFAYAPCQWETTLQCNVVSHWMGAYTKWPLLRLCYKRLTIHVVVYHILFRVTPMLLGISYNCSGAT